MRIALPIATITFALALGASTTQADVQPAMIGHGWVNGSNTNACFASSFARMQNVCSTTQLLIVPMQVGSTGWKHAYARFAGNGLLTGPTDCRAFAINPDNTFSNASGTGPVSTVSGIVQTIDLGFVSVPAHGTVHFECNVGPLGGQVVSVELE